MQEHEGAAPLPEQSPEQAPEQPQEQRPHGRHRHLRRHRQHRHHRRHHRPRWSRLEKLLDTLTSLRAISLATLVLIGATALVVVSIDTAKELLESGRAHLARNEPKAAIIQLKNALQKEPGLSEARVLLGTALLEDHDPISAEVEFRKALDLDQPENVVLPKLAQALLAMGEARKVTDRYASVELDPPSAAAALKTVVAQAYAAQNKLDLAQEALQAALKAEPDHIPALVLQARFQAMRGDVEGALLVAERALLRAPQDGGVLMLKGELLRSKADADGALAAFGAAAAAGPDRFSPRAATVSLLLARNELDKAAAEISLLRKDRPGHPQVLYLEAEHALRKGETKRAQELTQQLLKIAPESSRALVLSAAVALRGNSIARAEQLARKALMVEPNLPGARVILASTQIAGGEPGKALETLSPALEGGARPEELKLAASAYAQVGELAKAEELFTKAVQASPQDVRSRTALALTRLAKGRNDVAFAELESIAASDIGTTADIALVSAHLARRDFDGAMKAIAALEKKQPDKPLASNLRGRVQLARGERAMARESFERALAIDPSFLPAVEGLATVDLLEKNRTAAEGRFERLLKSNPANHRALLAMAKLRQASGADSEQVVSLIAQAVKAAPQEPAPRLALVSYHLVQKNFKEAVLSGLEAAAAFPDHPDILDALGRAQLASGDVAQAIATFGKLASARPQSPVPYVRLAQAHASARDNAAAAESARKAVGLWQGNESVFGRLIDAAVIEGRTSDALLIARTVQEQHSSSAVGHMLEGDIEAKAKHWPASIAAYRKAMVARPSTMLAQKLHLALLSSGNRAEGESMARDWMKARPDDAQFRLFVGSIALARNDLEGAEAVYVEAVRLQPSNAMALNNLAWVLAQLKKPGAVEYAEKATRLAPRQAVFLDTLAAALASENNLSRAVEVGRNAMELEPANHALRLNLAKLYLKAGDKAMARKELDALLQLGKEFALHNQVQQLRDSL